MAQITHQLTPPQPLTRSTTCRHVLRLGHRQRHHALQLTRIAHSPTIRLHRNTYADVGSRVHTKDIIRQSRHHPCSRQTTLENDATASSLLSRGNPGAVPCSSNSPLQTLCARLHNAHACLSADATESSICARCAGLLLQLRTPLTKTSTPARYLHEPPHHKANLAALNAPVSTVPVLAREHPLQRQHLAP